MYPAMQSGGAATWQTTGQTEPIASVSAQPTGGATRARFSALTRVVGAETVLLALIGTFSLPRLWTAGAVQALRKHGGTGEPVS